MQIKVYEPGTIVTLERLDVEGVITAIIIRGKDIIYEVAYYSDGERRLPWVNEFEFKVDPESKTVKVGFQQ